MKTFSFRVRSLCRCLTAFLAFAYLAASPIARADGTLTVLYDCANAHVTYGLSSELVFGNDGNLYGTGPDAATGQSGVAFKISPDGVFSVLHQFTDAEGRRPTGGLLLGSDGNFYGVAEAGGIRDAGTIFRMTPDGALTVLHNFTGQDDGDLPSAGLVQGKDGTLYGTTSGGGAIGAGVVFKITPAGAFTVLHILTLEEGSSSEGRLVFGRDGALYGTASRSGVNNNGTIFRVTTGGACSVVYAFTDAALGTPTAGLTLGSDGNFYGTTAGQYGEGNGTVFRCTPKGDFTSLHKFDQVHITENVGGLVQASDGNFYGTLPGYSIRGDDGGIYRVGQDGSYEETYYFTTTEASASQAPLVQGADGAMYGTSTYGGKKGGGTIFKFTTEGATVHPAFFSGEVALSNGVYYLQFPEGNYFGYYSYLANPRYLYHFDLGYEYVFDANDGKSGVYLYDFKSNDFFYTSPVFPFPYLYNFSLKAVLYYYPDPSNAGHYNTDGVRYFYNFNTGQIISK